MHSVGSNVLKNSQNFYSQSMSVNRNHTYNTAEEALELSVVFGSVFSSSTVCPITWGIILNMPVPTVAQSTAANCLVRTVVPCFVVLEQLLWTIRRLWSPVPVCWM